jgi:hypothetical protein
VPGGIRTPDAWSGRGRSNRDQVNERQTRLQFRRSQGSGRSSCGALAGDPESLGDLGDLPAALDPAITG